MCWLLQGWDQSCGHPASAIRGVFSHRLLPGTAAGLLGQVADALGSCSHLSPWGWRYYLYPQLREPKKALGSVLQLFSCDGDSSHFQVLSTPGPGTGVSPASSRTLSDDNLEPLSLSLPWDLPGSHPSPPQPCSAVSPRLASHTCAPPGFSPARFLAHI